MTRPQTLLRRGGSNYGY
ncbi:hypothetical protein [Escherichia coli]